MGPYSRCKNYQHTDKHTNRKNVKTEDPLTYGKNGLRGEGGGEQTNNIPYNKYIISLIYPHHNAPLNNHILPKYLED